VKIRYPSPHAVVYYGKEEAIRRCEKGIDKWAYEVEEERPCEVPFEEQCDQALKHYEELATKCMHWNSLVPQAIQFYKENYRSSPTTARNQNESSN